MKTQDNNAGFTLLELVIVTAIIAILITIALPRMVAIKDEAHKASIQSTAAALSTAVVMLRGQWLANGKMYAIDDVSGFGQQNIATSAQGWPTDAKRGKISLHNTDINNSDRCVRLWQALLMTNAPSVTVNKTTQSIYWVDTFKGSCRYTYQRTDDDSHIIYNARNGDVFTQL